MNILISNDDGVFAPGLIALANTLRDIAKVTVVAPESQRSGASSALSLDRPLKAVEISPNIWSVNGTPADCVYLALNGLLKDQHFDLVVSGINSGHNLGDHVLYSGTVGAALEGRHLALPALAISLVGSQVRGYVDPQDYLQAATWVKDFILKGLPKLPQGYILNINLPDVKDYAGALYTYQAQSQRLAPLVCHQDPHGAAAHWINLQSTQDKTIKPQINAYADFEVIAQNFISITPITTDRTHYSVLKALMGDEIF